MKESGKVDEAQTDRLVKLLEWLRQHGKTANTNKGDKQMSTIELTSVIAKLKEWEAIQAEAEAEVEALKDTIKAEMNHRGVEELEAGQYIARFTTVLSNRFDSTAFKKDFPQEYKDYTKQVTSRRFSIA